MKHTRFSLAATCVLALSACGETTVKETLGMDRRAPDEFRVVARPPLSVPPQFDLRPPSAAGTVSSTTRDKAQSLVLGDGSVSADTRVKPVVIQPIGKTTGATAAESTFLQKAGAAQADPNVKQELAEKRVNQQIEREEEGFWDKITTLPGNKEPVVKAQDEAARIQKNKDQGKPVTEGETPEAGGGPISVLKRWMGDE